jgi:hypothetical protein
MLTPLLVDFQKPTLSNQACQYFFAGDVKVINN